MIVVSNPLGGLLRVPDFGLSDVFSIKPEREREQLKDEMDTRGRDKQGTLKVMEVQMSAALFSISSLLTYMVTKNG